MTNESSFLMEFDPSYFRFCRQWVISDDENSLPKEWEKFKFPTNHVLVWHPLLRINFFSTSQGGIIAIGLPVNPTESSLGLFCEENLIHENLIKKLRKISGTYVIIRYTEDELFFYTDPGGMMGVYYTGNAAASTPSLLPDVIRDAAMDREYPLEVPDNWYTGSVTPFVGVKALIANHWLNFTQGIAKRFWPDNESFFTSSEGDVVKKGSNLLKGMMHEVSKHGKLLISLTGGKDSRLDTAASRDLVDVPQYFTVRGPWVPKCDIEIPAKLAKLANLNHRYVDCQEPLDWVAEYCNEINSGLTTIPQPDLLGAVMKLANKDAIHVSGSLAHFARSYFWHSGNPQQVKKSALLKEFVNKAPCIVRGVEEWLDSIPKEAPATTVYNLMYLEQRGGRWGGVNENISSLFYEPFPLFNSRELFEQVSSAPASFMDGKRIMIEFTRELWPELLSVPYCKSYRNIGAYLPKSLKIFFKNRK